MTIYRKGEFVKVKDISLLNEQVKDFANRFGRVCKVFSLETKTPFMIEFYNETKRETELFSHDELELRNYFCDEEERNRHQLQAKMFKMSRKI